MTCFSESFIKVFVRLMYVLFFACTIFSRTNDLHASDLPPQLPAPGGGEPVTIPSQLTLQDAMEITLRSHPQYRQAIHTYQANKEIIGQALSNYLPHVSAGAGYTYETGNFVISPGFPPSLYSLIQPPNNTGYNYYQAQLNVSETLFTFGQRVTQVRQARYNAKSSADQARWTLYTLLSNVEIAYDTLAEDVLLVDAAQKTLKDYEEQQQVAEGENQVGTASKFDVLNAQVNRSNAQLNLITAKNNVKIARVGLLNAMGISFGGDFHVIPSLEFELMDEDLDKLLIKAIKNRPDFISAKDSVNASWQNELYYKSTYLPSIGATGGYSYASMFLPMTYNWFMGATISIPIFSGFLTVHQVAQAQKTMAASQDSLEGLRQNVMMQVKQDYFNLKTSVERIDTVKTLLEQAKESLRLAEGQYRVGVGSAVAVTQAEADLASARAQFVQSVYGYKIARANLIRDIGMNPLVRVENGKHDNTNKEVMLHE